MKKYYFYKSYGLFIKSSINIPELDLIFPEKEFDVFITCAKLTHTSKKDYDIKNKSITKIRNNAHEISIFWNDELLFKVINGQKIITNSNVDINPTFLRSLILGRAMGTLLHQRGFLVLHASAVNINGEAVAFMGWRGNGKSTTTMSLLNSNYPLISDDVLALKIEDNNVLAIPSFPRIKLRQDIMESFTEEIDPNTQIHPDIKKHYYEVKNFSSTTIPLKRIYVLEKSYENKITNLEYQDAIINLIRHSYCVSILEGEEQQENLKQSAKLMKNVPIKCLNINHCIEKISELVDLVEKDLKHE